MSCKSLKLVRYWEWLCAAISASGHIDQSNSEMGISSQSHWGWKGTIYHSHTAD